MKLTGALTQNYFGEVLEEGARFDTVEASEGDEEMVSTNILATLSIERKRKKGWQWSRVRGIGRWFICFSLNWRN